MIIRNAIRCNICGDEIESTYRHDYVECKCGAWLLTVDMTTSADVSRRKGATQTSR